MGISKAHFTPLDVHDVYSRGEIRDLDGRPGSVGGYSNWPGRSGTLLPKGVPYLQKPFRLADLTKTVRLVLDDAPGELLGPA